MGASSANDKAQFASAMQSAMGHRICGCSIVHFVFSGVSVHPEAVHCTAFLAPIRGRGSTEKIFIPAVLEKLLESQQHFKVCNAGSGG